MLNESKQRLKELKADLKSEVTNQIIKLNKSILNDIKQHLKEMEEESASTSIAINMSVVNDQLKLMNQSMLNESKQRLKQLKELNETFTKKIAKCIQRVAKGDMTVGWGKSNFLSLHDTTDYLQDDDLNFEIFYEDTGAHMPDLSFEQLTQAYSAGDLVASIFHTIVEIIAVVLSAVLIILVILAFVLPDITGMKVVILQAVHYGVAFMKGVIIVVTLLAVCYGFIQEVIIAIVVISQAVIPRVIIGIIIVWIFKALTN